MSPTLITDASQLDAIAEEWDTLAAGVPMRGYDWLAGWWRHYDAGELAVVIVRDENNKLIGLAPWRLEKSLTRGAVLTWLGDGEVCTDHLTLLTQPGKEQAVAQAVADFLIDEFSDWQLLDLNNTDSGDTNLQWLVDALAERDALVESTEVGACWTLDLPDDWEAYLALQSKSHRKQLRRAERRVLESEDCRWVPVQNRDDWETAWPILIDLHQRRRLSLGEPGCFASECWAAFHREISLKLLEKNQLRLSWLELNGQPAAVEYHFAGPGAIYAYQGGVDPDRLDEEPGRLSIISTLQDAMREGRQTFDFMRGDEPYKAHWRATPRPTNRVRIVPPRGSARVLAGANDAADKMRSVVKAGLKVLGRK